jgi:cell shape-determining protein MreC
MKRVKAVVPIFLILLFLSLFILFFFQNSLTASLQIVTLPIQEWAFGMTLKPTGTLTPQEQLQQENNQLRTELAQIEEIKKDNQALHDQFQTTTPAPQKLLPADVIGVQPAYLLIGKGMSDGIHLGDVVVVKNNLIGNIEKVTTHISQVKLLFDPTTSFTAQSAKTSANGDVQTIDGGTIIFTNVVLSDKLEQNDIILTKGDRDAQGHGYPPDLVVGKITSIDKQASSLFQAAKVESLVDVSNLRMVFVMTQ